jgi:hypothetical protein
MRNISLPQAAARRGVMPCFYRGVDAFPCGFSRVDCDPLVSEASGRFFFFALFSVTVVDESGGDERAASRASRLSVVFSDF